MDQNNTTNRNGMDIIELDILEVSGVLLSKIWIIIGCAIISALATFLIVTYLVNPKYESTTKIYVINRQNNDALTYSDLQSGAQITKDYQELVKSRPVLDEVRAELNLDYKDKELRKMIVVSVPTDTRIVSMTVTNEDPYMARAIANQLRIAASQHIADVMDTEAVNVVEEANLPIEKSSPRELRDVVIGGMLGTVLAIIAIIMIYIMDDTIKNPDDVEKFLHVSVLGSIPILDEEVVNKKKKKKNKIDNSKKHVHTVQMRESMELKEAVKPEIKLEEKPVSEVNRELEKTEENSTPVVPVNIIKVKSNTDEKTNLNKQINLENTIDEEFRYKESELAEVERYEESSLENKVFTEMAPVPKLKEVKEVKKTDSSWIENRRQKASALRQEKLSGRYSTLQQKKTDYIPKTNATNILDGKKMF